MIPAEREVLVQNVAELVRKYQWDSCEDRAESRDIAGAILRLVEGQAGRAPLVELVRELLKSAEHVVCIGEDCFKCYVGQKCEEVLERVRKEHVGERRQPGK